MTVVLSGNTITFAGDGVQTRFDFGFRIYHSDDLSAVVRDVSGAERKLLLGNDFSVDSDFSNAGGSVTYPLSGVPIQSGESITIYREVDYVQNLELVDNDPFSASLLNEAFDRGVMRDQQLQEQVDRALKYDLTTPPADQLSAKDYIDNLNAAKDAAAGAQEAAEAARDDAVEARSGSEAAVSAASEARDDAREARDLAVAARDGAEAQTASIPGLIDAERNAALEALEDRELLGINAVKSQQDSSVGAVAAQQVSSVSTIESTGQAELDKLTALVPTVFDQESFFRSSMSSLLSGAMAGSEGRWRCEKIGRLTPTKVLMTSYTFLQNDNMVNLGQLGDDVLLLPSFHGIVFGDSGTGYPLQNARLAEDPCEFRNVALHARFGDVSSDFSVGKSYPVIVFKESAEDIDQQFGDMDMINIFTGNLKRTVDLFSPTVKAGGTKTPFNWVQWNSTTSPVTFEGRSIFVDDNGEDGLVTTDFYLVGDSNPYPVQPDDLLTLKLVNNSSANLNAQIMDGDGSSVFNTDIPPGESEHLTKQIVSTGGDVYIRLGSRTDGIGINAAIEELSLTRQDHSALYRLYQDSYTEIAPDPQFSSGSLDGWYVDTSVTTGLQVENGLFKMTGVGSGTYFQGAIGILPSSFQPGTEYLVEVTVDELPSGFVTVNSNLDTDLNITRAGKYLVRVTTDDPLGSLGVRISFRNVGAGDVVVVSRFSIKKPVSSYGILNAGYWNGQSYVSQSLENAYYDDPNGRISLYISAPSEELSSATVEVLDSAGEWKTWNKLVDVWGDSIFSYSNVAGLVVLDFRASYVSHGYASEAEMKEKSAVRIAFKTPARRFRPAENPQDIVVLDDYAYIYNGDEMSQGRGLIRELIGGVSKGEADLGSWTPVRMCRWYNDNRKIFELSYDILEPENSTANPAAIMIFALYKYGGTYHVAVWFKELIYDPDTENWGDDGKFYIVDNVVSTMDLNGNRIACGCMSFDTGIAVPA